MPEAMTFQMGKFPAVLPGELRYARNHMWCRSDGDRHRFGQSSRHIGLSGEIFTPRCYRAVFEQSNDVISAGGDGGATSEIGRHAHAE